MIKAFAFLMICFFITYVSGIQGVQKLLAQAQQDTLSPELAAADLAKEPIIQTLQETLKSFTGFNKQTTV